MRIRDAITYLSIRLKPSQMSTTCYRRWQVYRYLEVRYTGIVLVFLIVCGKIWHM